MIERFPVLDTSDADEMRMLLAGKGMHCPGLHRVPDRHGLCRINAVYGRQCYVAYIAYGGDLSVAVPEGGATYTVSIPLSGTVRVDSGRERAYCAGDSGAITSPSRDTLFRMSDHAQRLSISLDRQLLEGHLERLCQHHVSGSISFKPGIDFGSGHGLVLRAAVQSLAEHARGGVNPLDDPMYHAHFEDTVIGALLLNQQHSFSHRLGRDGGTVMSRDVRRAIDFIHGHLEDPLTLSDLVRASGVPARTLNEHFRAMTGFPPMSYLRRERLRAIRRVLETDPAATVTTVAMRFGFVHLGRFAAEYRRMFGEIPSETRRAAFGGNPPG